MTSTLSDSGTSLAVSPKEVMEENAQHSHSTVIIAERGRHLLICFDGTWLISHLNYIYVFRLMTKPPVTH